MRQLGVWVCLVSGVLGACASTAPVHSPARADAQALRFTAPLDRDHPLVGRIFDVAHARFLSEPELIERLVGARLIALGEQHDNADHHLLQARLLRELVAHNVRPAVVFEMLDRTQQPNIDRALAERPDDVDGLGRAVDFDHSGWPAWSTYRPIFVEALRAHLPIVAAGLDRTHAMQLASDGVAALDPALVRAFALDRALPAASLAPLRAEMADVHCGLLPDSMLDAMVLVQRARDAQLAERMHAKTGAALLIAGAGHVRNDRGVPADFARAYAEPVLSVALLEVQTDLRAPANYAAAFASEQLPFDFVWFTPRASDADHCAELRAKSGAGR